MKPTKEEMLAFVQEGEGREISSLSDKRLSPELIKSIQDRLEIRVAIRAIIESKRTVTQGQIDGFVSSVYDAYANGTIRKTIIKILAELGIGIEDKGDVPIINEEGFSNEEKP